MTRAEIAAVQREIGLPKTWEECFAPTRHYLSGEFFQAELKGRISIEADEAGWIAIHTEAGPIMIRKQVLNIDGGEL